MLGGSTIGQQCPRLFRRICSSSSSSHQAVKRLPTDSTLSPTRDEASSKSLYRRDDAKTQETVVSVQRHVKRNELGVQLLSRKLHEQVFKGVSFPPPDASYVNIAKEHITTHGLDPAQGSVLPDTGFDLPPLQGSTLLHHFHNIGAECAEPWLSLSQSFTGVTLPPQPDHWDIQAGWTKYYHMPDGSSYSEHVKYPMHEGKPESMLVFDVETLPNEHPYAIMACAASPNAWYAWISPWLLKQSEDPQQLIPFGSNSAPRVVVGHNVSYDRARILEEYNLEAGKTRFLDTMALHVAVKGISSHQRPAWMKHRKSKEVELEQKEEAKEAVLEMLAQCDDELSTKNNPHAAELMRLKDELSESLASSDDAYEEQVSSKRWEDITSANSLADVAKLHCGIHMSKAIRNDFMKLDSDAILAGITDYLSYCANDVSVTHAVFSRVLPAFLQSCPHPVSFAGILTMGSSFLCVNQEWEKYLENAEKTYRDMAETVKSKLLHLAEEAKRLAIDSSDEKPWLSDPWLSQLDWTPKVAGITRGVMPPAPPAIETPPKPLPVIVEVGDEPKTFPAWFAKLVKDPLCAANRIKLLPILLRFEYDGYPLLYTKQDLWHYMKDGEVHRLPTTSGNLKMTTMLSRKHVLPGFASGRLTSRDPKLAIALTINGKDPELAVRVVEYAQGVLDEFGSAGMHDPSLSQLDWKLMEVHANTRPRKAPQVKPKAKPKSHTELWPKWYWDATAPKKGCPPGTLDITVRSFIAPLLLRLSWLGHPLFKSREHGWTFRVPAGVEFTTRSSPVTFYDPADDSLAEMALSGGYVFYKLPHKDGEKANVGNPLSKPFMKFAQDGTLKGSDGTAAEALDVNAQCSYWISARDRVLGQMVVWQQKKRDLGIAPKPTKNQKWGIIIPQVITMGTVTRRAIEKTWLTASNAKKNRVGSELKALVRAPPGYAIVGADVDSEELWISSCMGDAQFGLHGATALGWMTLEGTKAAGTDLHSKTANILGISRDQAKVFNYSRIYGAGMRHAILLLLQSNAEMLPEQAQKLAENLYASTKGKNTHRTDIFGRKFWFGGTESFVFNKLEEIALSAKPETPALGCGVTHALSKEFLPSDFGADYMPSRINWVVQSSGVDYLHLLIVSMDHLIQKYDIQARYLISVHDEVRYLVKEEDKYRVALALQIANLWTRSLFAMKLGMSDLPQGVAFFSAVDVDHVLRKEVDLPCVTPSQPIPIPPGESLTIQTVLEKTHGGSLWSDGRPMSRDVASVPSEFNDFVMPDCLSHRAASAAFLQAQSTTDFEEIKHLAKLVSGTEVKGGIGEGARPKMKRGRKPKPAPLAASVDMDPSLADEEFKRCKHLD